MPYTSKVEGRAKGKERVRGGERRRREEGRNAFPNLFNPTLATVYCISVQSA